MEGWKALLLFWLLRYLVWLCFSFVWLGFVWPVGCRLLRFKGFPGVLLREALEELLCFLQAAAIAEDPKLLLVVTEGAHDPQLGSNKAAPKCVVSPYRFCFVFWEGVILLR